MIFIEDLCQYSFQHRREENQDRCWTFVFDPAPSSSRRIGVQCVFDGVSHANGREAAEIASGKFFEGLLPMMQNLDGLAALEEEERTRYIDAAMRETVRRVDSCLRNRTVGPTACTVSCAIEFCDRIHICNVGDSPILLADLRRGTMTELYQCHNEAGRAVAEGRMTRQEALTAPGRNRLIWALGGGERALPEEAIYTASRVLPQEAVLLLGSDGALSVLPEEELMDIVFRNGNSMKNLCNAVLDAVEAGTSSDNFTLIANRLQRG